MNVSPMDLRQQRFHTRFRGFDKIEVTALLAAVAEDYEQALRETDRLRQELSNMEVQLNGHRAARAQPARDPDDGPEAVRRHQVGRRKGRPTASSAKPTGASQLLLDKAEGRLEDIQREIDGLKLKRRDVETSIEATIQTLRNSLEYVREQEIRDRDEKILFHRPARRNSRPALRAP